MTDAPEHGPAQPLAPPHGPGPLPLTWEDPGSGWGSGQPRPAGGVSDVDDIPGATGPTGRSRIIFAAITTIVIAALVLEASGVFTGGGTSGGPQAADLPPAGSIWFGSSFDASTFVLGGRTTTVGPNAPFAFIARLTRAAWGSELTMRWSWNGSLVRSTALRWAGEGEVWGGSTGPLAEPGDWRLELTDLEGNTLASGSLEVTGGSTVPAAARRPTGSCPTAVTSRTGAAFSGCDGAAVHRDTLPNVSGDAAFLLAHGFASSVPSAESDASGLGD